MSRDPLTYDELTATEIRYADETLASVLADGTSFASLRSATLECDGTCGWQTEHGRCDDPIQRVCILYNDHEVQVVTYCLHHAECMDAVIGERCKGERRLVRD